jgi:hypothetical protein
VSGVDWPLAVGLAVVFVVLTAARVRYFRALARRRRPSTDAGRPPDA